MSVSRSSAAQPGGTADVEPTIRQACRAAQKLAREGRLGDALALLQEAQRLAPEDPMVRLELAEVARLAGRTGLAVDILEKTLLLCPDCVEALNNLGVYLREQGEIAASLAHYRRALALRPRDPRVWSGYLFTLHCDPDVGAQEIAEQHQRFGDLLPPNPRRACRRTPGKVLRVAYLSADFRRHPVATFIAPVLAAHDRQRVHVTCYAASSVCDDVTRELQGSADRWRQVDGVDDAALATLVERDGIEVLVDLAGHTAGNRLAALARGLAPVQMTYLGYPDTTGVSAIDYRITDALVDPPGDSDSLCTETLLRLPGGFLAYRPPAWARDLPVAPSPASRAGVFTFGSFGSLSRINPAVLAAWAEILARAPGTRLLLKAPGLHDARVRERIAATGAAHGIDAGRLVLLEPTASPVEHMRLHDLVDLALDTFPYNGTTTTCEALWMGVPVLTMAGDRHAGRVGRALLGRLGLDDLVAADPSSYVERAVALAESRQEVAHWREQLRPRLSASPLTDSVRLATELEDAYCHALAERQGSDSRSPSRS